MDEPCEGYGSTPHHWSVSPDVLYPGKCSYPHYTLKDCTVPPDVPAPMDARERFREEWREARLRRKHRMAIPYGPASVVPWERGGPRMAPFWQRCELKPCVLRLFGL